MADGQEQMIDVFRPDGLRGQIPASQASGAFGQGQYKFAVQDDQGNWTPVRPTAVTAKDNSGNFTQGGWVPSTKAGQGLKDGVFRLGPPEQQGYTNTQGSGIGTKGIDPYVTGALDFFGRLLSPENIARSSAVPPGTPWYSPDRAGAAAVRTVTAPISLLRGPTNQEEAGIQNKYSTLASDPMAGYYALVGHRLGLIGKHIAGNINDPEAPPKTTSIPPLAPGQSAIDPLYDLAMGAQLNMGAGEAASVLGMPVKGVLKAGTIGITDAASDAAKLTRLRILPDSMLTPAEQLTKVLNTNNPLKGGSSQALLDLHDAVNSSLPKIQQSAANMGLNIKSADDLAFAIQQAKGDILSRHQAVHGPDSTLADIGPSQATLLNGEMNDLENIQNPLRQLQASEAAKAAQVAARGGAATPGTAQNVSDIGTGLGKVALGQVASKAMPFGGTIARATMKAAGITSGFSDIARGIKGVMGRSGPQLDSAIENIFSQQTANPSDVAAQRAIEGYSPNIPAEDAARAPYSPYTGDRTVQNSTTIAPPQQPYGDAQIFPATSDRTPLWSSPQQAMDLIRQRAAAAQSAAPPSATQVMEWLRQKAAAPAPYSYGPGQIAPEQVGAQTATAPAQNPNVLAGGQGVRVQQPLALPRPSFLSGISDYEQLRQLRGALEGSLGSNEDAELAVQKWMRDHNMQPEPFQGKGLATRTTQPTLSDIGAALSQPQKPGVMQTGADLVAALKQMAASKGATPASASGLQLGKPFPKANAPDMLTYPVTDASGKTVVNIHVDPATGQTIVAPEGYSPGGQKATLDPADALRFARQIQQDIGGKRLTGISSNERIAARQQRRADAAPQAMASLPGETPEQTLARLLGRTRPQVNTATATQQMAQGEATPGTYGADTSVLTPTTSLPAKYKIVEADSLTPSHNPVTFAKNPEYPSGVQERTYDTDKEAQRRVIYQAQNYDPRYTVNTNPDAVNGPPVVTKDGIVLGGNSRAMSTQRLYQTDGGAYRNYLAANADQFGMTPEQVKGMTKPVLIREIDSPANIEEARRLGSDLNKNMTGALTDAQRAVSAGKSIRPESLTAINALVDDLGEGATLRDAMRVHGDHMLQILNSDGVISSRERPQFVDTATGGLNDAGKDFVENALLGSVVDDARLMQAAPKSVLNKLDGSLADFASLSSRGDEYNILPIVRDAIQEHAEMAQRGMNVNNYLGQNAMFGPPRNPATDAVVRFLAARPKDFKAAIGQFAADARVDVQNQGMLGMGPTPTPAGAFNSAFGTNLSEDQFADALTRAMGREAGRTGTNAAGQSQKGSSGTASTNLPRRP